MSDLQSYPPKEGDEIEASDYSNSSNWAEICKRPCKPVDVFLLYPTTYQGEEPLAEITDKQMREGADEWLRVAGSAFGTAGNVFMPYYRQLNAMWVLTIEDEAERTAFQNGAPKTDALAAFEFYLKHFNQGRPFIIASHSQGSAMNKEILFDYLAREENKEIARRLIASYVIGNSVTQKDLDCNPNMKFAEGAFDTGVIISYNTVTPDADPSGGSLIAEGALAINPITWTRGNETACVCQNLGSFVDSGNGFECKDCLADATVKTLQNRQVVVCSTADPTIYTMPKETKAAFGTGSFHGNDIGFYYCNLRQNANIRVGKFLNSVKNLALP